MRPTPNQPVAQSKNQITRRTFTKMAAAGTSTLLAAPAILRGQNLNDKLNIAVIGAGGRGPQRYQGGQFGEHRRPL